MLIALIDDGIDKTYCPGLTLKYDLVVEGSGTIRPRRSQEPVLTNHGTTCAQIIHKYAPSAEFCSLSIFSRTDLKANRSQFIFALMWCREQRIPLIHMSVGSVSLSDYGAIRNAVSDLIQHGQILVAAQHNGNSRYTMPACFSGVYGVSADPALRDSSFRINCNSRSDGVQILASARHDLSAYPNGTVETIVANSYAAPTITAHLHQLLCQPGIGSTSAQALYKRLASDMCASLARLRPDFLKEAIVYDFNQILPQTLVKYRMFHTQEIFSEAAHFLRAIELDQYTPILLLPSKSENPHFFKEIFRQSVKRAGIVYAGTAPADIKKISPCLFWDESVYASFMTSISESSAYQDIPKIMVEPCGEAAVRFLCKLERILAENAYNCVAVSDFSKSYLYNLLMVPNSCQVETLLSHICCTHQPDVILYSLRNEYLSGLHNLRIMLADICEPVFSQKGDEAIFPENPSDNQICALYRYLLKE